MKFNDFRNGFISHLFWVFPHHIWICLHIYPGSLMIPCKSLTSSKYDAISICKGAGCWWNSQLGRANMATMALDQLQFGGGLRSRLSNSFGDIDKIRKLCYEGKLKEAMDMVKFIMQQSSIAPISAYVCVLKECARRKALLEGKQVHALIIQSNCQANMTVANNLVEMYSKCGSVLDAHMIFSQMRHRNVFSWTALISAYVDSGKCEKAINLFREMQKTSIAPDKVALVIVLKACARIAALEDGKELHSLIQKRGLESDVIVQSILVDMYAKCGCLDDARGLFDNMSERDVVSWNAMIQGCVQNGLGKEALALYDQMRQEGVQPNKVTYISVLCACSHSGLVEEGWQIFDSIYKNRKVTLTLEHYACMVDLLGRAGCLADAENFVLKMPIQPDKVIWMSLLGAARNYCHVEIGRRAFDNVVKLEPKNITPYLLLLDIYAAAGMIDEVAKIEKQMKEIDLNRVARCSWTKIDVPVYSYVEGDTSHEQDGTKVDSG